MSSKRGNSCRLLNHSKSLFYAFLEKAGSRSCMRKATELTDFDPVDLWSSNSPNQIERAGMINTNNGNPLETCVHEHPPFNGNPYRAGLTAETLTSLNGRSVP
eukprot:scaffold8546_cov73-Cylindrotheca_fusiformis.AAC.1